jgi:hypothetical protein
VNRLLDPSPEGRTIGAIARSLVGTAATAARTETLLQGAIDDTERVLAELREPMPGRPRPTRVKMPPLEMCPTFDSLLAASPADAGVADALTDAEIRRVLTDLHATGDRALGPRRLDLWDVAIAGVAGLLAGIADIVFVGLPRHPRAFGPEGGILPQSVHAAFGNILPEKTTAGLEAAFKVPYDRSTNYPGSQVVAGLFPSSHRFHSLGHDPILGWIFGVVDVLHGTMTTIGIDGAFLAQPTSMPQAGQSLFIGILIALQRVGGHMLSDVATPMGLPAPLMPLASLFANTGFGTRPVCGFPKRSASNQRRSTASAWSSGLNKARAGKIAMSCCHPNSSICSGNIGSAPILVSGCFPVVIRASRSLRSPSIAPAGR